MPAVGKIGRCALAGLLLGLALGSAHAHWDGVSPFAQDEQILPLYAIRPPNIFYHNVGLLQIMITNVGVIGNPGFVDSYGAGWEGSEYLYAASLWFGAVASDNLPYVSTGAYENELLPSQRVVDTIYESFEGSPGGDRVGFSPSGGDDDLDGLIDEDPLNGKDDDEDGLIDEDYAAVSQQMLSCEYWDYTDEAVAMYPQHRPLYIKVRQKSMAWSTEGANEFVGLEYIITNDGFESLRDIYIGYFVDSDAGVKSAQSYWTDDGGELRSVDTTYTDKNIQYSCTDVGGDTRDCSRVDLHMDIAFMRDTPGHIPGGNAADDPRPGANGYFGGMFLGHTTDPLGARAPKRVQIHTCHFFSRTGTYPIGDPTSDFERYDLLSRGTKPRGPTGRPDDYRYAFSAGPFRELLPGEELEFQVAFVIGNEWNGLLHNAIMAQRIFNGQWRDADGHKLTGCHGRETCLHIEPGGQALRWADPCDSLSSAITIKNTTCDHPSYWVDNDCNCCTPLQPSASRCDGWESLIHWVGTVAPPPPAMSTEDPSMRLRVEGDEFIKIEWDNTSELVADPISGEIRFCGYRIWRVEGWTRPFGSTGPAPEEWQLIADLAGEPVGSQYPLTDFTNPYAAVIDRVPSPTEDGEYLNRYEVGRYFFVDTLGVKNGMLYFYDVTAYSCWVDENGYGEMTSRPTAVEDEGVRAQWAAVPDSIDWTQQVIVVPNPWRGHAAWDLHPSDSDPTGTHIAFANLPEKQCDVRIYTLTGDLVQTLRHNGRYGNGTARWNLISRNGQDISSGVYLYAITCDGETSVGRFTIIR